MKKHQCEIVLNHLIDHGYITQTIASNYGVRRLASRINDLKKQGVLVASEMRKDDLGVRYVRYTLVEPGCEAIRRRNGFSWKMNKFEALPSAA